MSRGWAGSGAAWAEAGTRQRAQSLTATLDLQPPGAAWAGLGCMQEHCPTQSTCAAQPCLERRPAKEGWLCPVPHIAAILGSAVIATSGGCVPSLAGVKKTWQAKGSTCCYASRNTTLISY